MTEAAAAAAAAPVEDRTASTGSKQDRHTQGLVELVLALTGRQKGGVFMTVLAMLGLSLSGILGFVQDAPALLSANSRASAENTSAIAENTLAIGELAAAVAVNQNAIADLTIMARSIEAHFTEEAAADLVRDRKLDYLICLRTERARELEGLPPAEDCFALSLSGG